MPKCPIQKAWKISASGKIFSRNYDFTEKDIEEEIVQVCNDTIPAQILSFFVSAKHSGYLENPKVNIGIVQGILRSNKKIPIYCILLAVLAKRLKFDPIDYLSFLYETGQFPIDEKRRPGLLFKSKVDEYLNKLVERNYRREFKEKLAQSLSVILKISKENALTNSKQILDYLFDNSAVPTACILIMSGEIIPEVILTLDGHKQYIRKLTNDMQVELKLDPNNYLAALNRIQALYT